MKKLHFLTIIILLLFSAACNAENEVKDDTNDPVEQIVESKGNESDDDSTKEVNNIDKKTEKSNEGSKTESEDHETGKTSQIHLADQLMSDMATYNHFLLQLKLPNIEDFYYQSGTVHFTNDAITNAHFRFVLDIVQKNDMPTPLDLSIKPYHEKEHKEYLDNEFVEEYYDGTEFLIYDGNNKSIVVYEEDGFLYKLSSEITVTNQETLLLNSDELMHIKQNNLIENSPHLEKVILSPGDYAFPNYLPEYNQDSLSMIVSNRTQDDKVVESKSEGQELIYSNDYIHFAQSKGTHWEAKDTLEEPRNSFQPLEIGRIKGYLNESEPYEFVFEEAGSQFYIRPSQQVDDSGRVWIEIPENWETEVSKLVENLFN